MISRDPARAAVVIILPFSNGLLMICIMVFLMETFTTLYGPAKDSSIPDLVRTDQLTNANSLNSVTMFASMAFGTAIAGAIVGLVGWLGKLNPGFIGVHFDPNRSAFFLDSITFFISAYLIFRIHFKERESEQIVKPSSHQVKSDIKDGIAYMWTHDLTRIVLFLVVVCFLGGGTVYVLAVGFVKYVLGGGNATFMAVLTTLLFGLMAGSLLAGLLKGFLAKEKWLGWAVFTFGMCVAIFPGGLVLAHLHPGFPGRRMHGLRGGGDDHPAARDAGGRIPGEGVLHHQHAHAGLHLLLHHRGRAPG